ncbi:glycosyltransferase [Citrobacter farmeri]|uniref:glycosyltransferase n=1 Tax=Citrobacter farmeri TaxID=67824 RepID=UPI00190741AE|nr:glycosyltransferase [Citrobacter farmeri]MBJ9162009.1 glycosyltransferase [Citrobacter farmeri]
MKVLHVCYSDFDGGAAKAANRLHQAQLKEGINSSMLVVNKVTADKTVISVNKISMIRVKVISLVSRFLLSKFKDSNPVKHSLNIFPTGVGKIINNLNPDIVNLHWIGDGMISIGEVAKIKAPIVWTMHDMWAFSGCEHYDSYPELLRYQDNYTSRRGVKGFDLNRYVYRLKLRKWKSKKIQFVSPSKWLGDCAAKTEITKGKKIHIIQNTIDHSVYMPVKKEIARELLELPADKKIILFGAMASTTDIRKGFSLLDEAIKFLSENYSSDYALVVFGADKQPPAHKYGFDIYNLGVFRDELSLRLLYSATDVYVAPSLQDNLPNTIVEAFAVGTPCIAFNIGGMPDLLNDAKMGELVEEINSESLGEAINRVLEAEAEHEYIRKKSLDMRAEEYIVSQYKMVYSNV